MKKIFLFFLVIPCFLLKAQVQKLDPNATNKKDVVAPINKLNAEAQEAANTWIDIYELPNYQGQKVRFTQTKELTAFPFALDNISIKKGNFITTKVTINVEGNLRGTEIEIKNDAPNIRVGNGGIGFIRFKALPWIEIFEQPNQQGRSVKFVEDIVNRENLNLPFLTNNISVKLSSDDVMVTLSLNCNNLKTYAYIDRVKANLNFPNTNICGLHIGKKAAIRLRFNGILTAIHNNDCKRMYGTIRYRIIEKDVNGNIVGFSKTIKASESTQWGWVNVFNAPKNDATVYPLAFDVNKYFVQERDGHRSNRVLGNLHDAPRDGDTYILHYFDSLAFQQNRIFLEVTANIGSHHKGCDLCTDYTDNASMVTAVVKLIPITRNAPFGQLQVGKYRATGGQGDFSGSEHATYLDFTFTPVGYNFYRQAFPY